MLKKKIIEKRISDIKTSDKHETEVWDSVMIRYVDDVRTRSKSLSLIHISSTFSPPKIGC